MAEPYFDADKLVRWLSLHSPVAGGKTTLVFDDVADCVVTADYDVALQIERPGEPLVLSLAMIVSVGDLFAPTAAPFTMAQLGELNDAGELDEKYAERVENELKLFRFHLAWHMSARHPINVTKVAKRDNLDQVLCYLHVQGTLPARPLSVGYTSKPYVSLTDDPVKLSTFLDETTLDQAWQECWSTGVKFREFF